MSNARGPREDLRRIDLRLLERDTGSLNDRVGKLRVESPHEAMSGEFEERLSN